MYYENSSTRPERSIVYPQYHCQHPGCNALFTSDDAICAKDSYLAGRFKRGTVSFVVESHSTLIVIDERSRNGHDSVPSYQPHGCRPGMPGIAKLVGFVDEATPAKFPA